MIIIFRYLDNNGLIGNIPSSFGNLVNLEELFLFHFYFLNINKILFIFFFSGIDEKHLNVIPRSILSLRNIQRLCVIYELFVLYLLNNLLLKICWSICII